MYVFLKGFKIFKLPFKHYFRKMSLGVAPGVSSRNKKKKMKTVKWKVYWKRLVDGRLGAFQGELYRESLEKSPHIMP